MMLLVQWCYWCSWCCWCCDAADALLMQWCCWWAYTADGTDADAADADTADGNWCADAADVMVLLMRCCYDAAEELMLLLLWCCWYWLEWCWIGTDWYWIDIWLGVAWHWIGSGLTPDWHPIDRLDRHQSGTGFDKYPLVRPGCPDVPFPGMEYKTDVDKTVGHEKWPVSSFGKLVSHWVIWVNFEIVSHLSLVWNSHKKRTKSPTPYLTPRFALFVGSENEYMYIWVHTMWASSPM